MVKVVKLLLSSSSKSTNVTSRSRDLVVLVKLLVGLLVF